MNVPSPRGVRRKRILSHSSHLHQTRTRSGFLPARFWLPCFDVSGFINQPSAPREPQRLGSPVPKSQGALSVTQGFCLNISQAANPPVKADSVGEHICKTKQALRPTRKPMTRAVNYSLPAMQGHGCSQWGEALFITVGSVAFRYPPSPSVPFRF